MYNSGAAILAAHNLLCVSATNVTGTYGAQIRDEEVIENGRGIREESASMMSNCGKEQYS